MSKIDRNEHEVYPEYALSTKLLKHQQEMLKFLFFTSYDIIAETFQLKHASYLNLKKGYPVQNFKTEEIERHFNLVSEKLHIRVLREDIDLDKKLAKLEILWHSKSIPFFHRYYFEKYLLSAFMKELEALMDNEQKLIRSQTHIYFSTFKTINAREACLRQMKNNLADLNADDVYEYLHVAKERFFNDRKKNQTEKYLKRGYIIKESREQNPNQGTKHSKTKVQFFSDNFNHLTKLTLYTLDVIVKWKEYIYSLTHDARKKRERIEYYFYDDNYYLKILSDTLFVKVSFLGRFFKFAPKNDPFLIWPVLAFQKQQEKGLDNELLKQIFMPQQEHLAEIMNKIEILAEEYKWNIRSRKTYDINVLKKPAEIEHDKKRLDQQNEPVSNLVLKKVEGTPPRRAKSFKNFRVREEVSSRAKNPLVSKSQKDKIVVEFKPSPKKRLSWLPGANPHRTIETDSSPLKNSVILEKNKPKQNQNQMDEELLKMLKKEVIRKIKEDFDTKAATEHSEKDEALEMYINNKINDAVKGIFPFEPEKELKPPIELTSYRVSEQQLSQEIQTIVKWSSHRFTDMQYNVEDLAKKIDQAQYVYFMKATAGEEYLGSTVVTLDTDTKDYKALKTLFVGFSHASQLSSMMVETVKFFEEYENAFEFIFPFFQVVGNDRTKDLLTTIERELGQRCLIASKQIYSNISEVRFIFKRQNKNVNFYPNKFPSSLHFKLALLHSEKKLFLQTSKIEKTYNENLYYDFLMSEILRRLQSSENTTILKQKAFSSSRFKNLMATMLQHQKSVQQFGVNLKFYKAENISELNNELTKKQKNSPYLQLSDLNKSNSLHLITMSMELSLPYKTKAVIGKNNEAFFKISVRQQIMAKIVGRTKFYKLPIEDNRISKSDKTKKITEKFIVLFDASEYFGSTGSSQVSKSKDLATYLLETLKNDETSWSMQLISELWIPMNRYPKQYEERQDLFIATHRLLDLKEIKKQMAVGEFLEWFCDLRMNNGVKYKPFEQKKLQNSVLIERPLGFALLAGPEELLVYAKVIQRNFK